MVQPPSPLHRPLLSSQSLELMVRLPKDEDAEILKERNVRPMDFTGRRMKGFYFVRPAGLRTTAGLRKWVGRCSAYVSTLPPKA